MNKKFMGTVLVVFTLIFSVLVVEAYAHDYGKTKGHYGDLKEKFSEKVHFFLKNQEELELSNEQIEKIKDSKIKAQKDIIRKDAELKILALDLQGGLGKDTINTGEINKLIDKKYDFKKEKEKSLVDAYAALKNVLTKEQKEKMKGLWKKCKKKMMHGSMMKGKMGYPMMKDKMQSYMERNQ